MARAPPWLLLQKLLLLTSLQLLQQAFGLDGADCHVGSPAVCWQLHRRIDGHMETIARKREAREVRALDPIELHVRARPLPPPPGRACILLHWHVHLHTLMEFSPAQEAARTRRTGTAASHATPLPAALAAPLTSSDRRLSAVSASSPIRILPQYQLPADMPAASQALVQQVVSAAIKTIQGYVQVKHPPPYPCVNLLLYRHALKHPPLWDRCLLQSASPAS